MCRMFGFCGPEVRAVRGSLLEAPNALQVQSLEHPDGWGIGHYLGQSDTPLVVRGINPAFADEEFARVAGQVASQTVLAHVRKASCGPVALANTHPFHHERWLFAHNGTVTDFAAIRGQLEAEIDPDLRALAQGETDSERCFLLVLSRLRARQRLDHPGRVESLIGALREVAELVHQISARPGVEPSSLTFLLCDGQSLAGHRNGRSLHLATGEGELLLASEIPSAERDWAELHEGATIGRDAERLAHSDGALPRTVL